MIAVSAGRHLPNHKKLALIGSGVVLFLIAPLINKLMHGVK